MASLEEDMEQWVDEIEMERRGKVFDDKVANALANSNVEMTVNKNKTMTK